MSGTAGGEICAPISIDGVPEDFLGLLVVPDLLNMLGSLARLREPTWLPSAGCLSWKFSNSVRRVFKLLRKSSATTEAACDELPVCAGW